MIAAYVLHADPITAAVLLINGVGTLFLLWRDGQR